MISPPVLKAPTPNGLFQLESDTSREGMGSTLLQKQGDEWVAIGYHSKRLPKSAKNFGVTELELTELLANIHSFMQLLSNRYFKVLVDHKAIEYMIKSKTESPMRRLKTLLLKLSEYTIDLKYQKGSEMHTSNALSRLHNFTDTPDQKDVIPLNFLQHFTPHYIEHSYSHLVENLYAHKTKTLDTTRDQDEDVSILEEDNSQIYAYLDNVLVHMIDKQQTAIFKSNQDFNKNKENISQYIKYAENWQVASVICSFTAMASDVLLIVAMIAFLLKYQKTMQAMLAAFLQTNTKNTAIQPVQADRIGRTYPPLFTINLPKEEEIIDDLREITTMEYVVQVIMIIVCIAIVLIIMYFCCTKCRHTHTIFKYCFPFLLISHIVCTSRHTDLFVEVTNVTKGNGIWAHFISTGCFLSQIQLSRPIQKDDVQIEIICCIFKWIRINWSDINVTGISGTMINMPDMAYVSIFTDNDLTHITEDHFEIKLIARLLDQMHVVQPPVFPPRYDDAPPSAPQFPEHLHSLLTHS